MLDGKDHQLTNRQKDILRLIAEGLTSEECGARLNIGPKTVEFHAGLLQTKLGVNGRAGLIRYAIQTGIIKH